jgi:hypothetical protein
MPVQSTPPQQQPFTSLLAAALGASPSLDEMLDAPFGLPPEPPTIGEQYANLWASYLQAATDWKITQDDLAKQERAFNALVEEAYLGVFPIGKHYDVDREIQKKAGEIRTHLIRAAQHQFAPPGVRLEIDSCEVGERFPYDEDKPEAFDPAGIWAWLEATYGGDAGERLAWAQTAKELTSHLRMKGEAVVIRGGYVVLEKHVYIDSFDKKWGRTRIHHSSGESVSKACAALSEIARWAERIGLSRDLADFGSSWWRGDRTLESRKQYPLGNNGEVVVVTYQNKFEFKLKKDFAEQVQMFMGTYGESAE